MTYLKGVRKERHVWLRIFSRETSLYTIYILSVKRELTN